MRIKTLMPVVGFALLLTATSCGGTSSINAERQVIQASRVTSYSSLRQAAQDADLIVLGKITDSSNIEYIEDVPFTVTNVEIQRTIGRKSVDAPTTVKLRQLGTTDTLGNDPLLETGATYLLALSRFRAGADNHVTDQWTIVGVQAGAYKLDGPNGSTGRRIDKLSPDMPAIVRVDDPMLKIG